MKEDNSPNDLSYIPSDYSKAFNQYSKTQIKFVLPFLTSISKTCHFGHLFPIYKVLKAVSKFFLLNEIQVIFLAYIIRETGWDIKQRIISSNAQNIQDIVCYSIQSLDFKRTILYLMISAYTVKYYLNKNTSEELEEASKRCPNFKQIFESWAKKHSTITTKINPRTLNSVYKHLYSDLRRENRDFNLMVDSILQISPAYNPQKDKNKKDDKKRQANQLEYGRRDNFMLKHDKNGYIPGHPLFSSHQILSVFQNQANAEEKHQAIEANLNPFMPFNKGVNRQTMNIFGSNMFAEKNLAYDLKDDDECKQLGIGFGEGISSENGEGKNLKSQSQLDVPTLKRGISIADNYLSNEAKVDEDPGEKK